ncbi:OmpL47-type beta-barrel domain-containing protein [Paenibacillus chartarius]|uniref:OmpL47-type beta-barrel domain-containing protein n=1 Tax=Paenibacillus chartarius TaxID=747481 RepID=A0ABV6DFN7_9BACL
MKRVNLWKSSFLKTTLALALALPVSTAVVSGLSPAHAEGPADPAPFINARVVNDNAGKKVLFDNTHGQTAGAADWVIDGAFSDFGNALADNGYYVKELRKAAPITFDDLKDYNVFVIPEANIPYKQSEQAAMKQYVENGGSIFFIGDHYNADRNKNRWDASEVFNGYRRGAWTDPAKGMSDEERNSPAMQGVTSSDWLSENFGVRFRYNALGDVIANDIVAPEQAFGITNGVSTVAMHAGSTLAITDPAKAKGIVYVPQTNEAWGNAVDQGVYNDGGRAEGPYVAVAKTGAGKAAFIGDSSPVEDISPKYLREENGAAKTTYDGFKEEDDGALLVNLVNWLAKSESYTSLSQVPNLQLDQPTALLPFEAPAASTEPAPEPWSTPAAGYKWWDMTTFKPGSYGGPTIEANPKYSFVHQAQLPNAEQFQIRVVGENLKAGATLTGFQVGIYLTGGTQVAQVQNADGTWPSSYGYSTAFSLTADSNGRATKTLTIRIKPGTSGAANLRIRQGSTNLTTTPVTLANVPAEPLPPDGPVEPALITIAEARTKAEKTAVTVEGVVTTEPGSFGGQAFYLQDSTAGIYVFQSQTGFHQGDKVKVTAPLALFNTELELANPTSIKKTGTAPLPAAAPVAAVNDANQGQLVKLENVTITNIVTASPAGSFEFDAVSGAVSNHVRVDGRTGLTLSNFPYKEGQQVSITGVSAIFRGAYQLKPRGLADFALSDTAAPVTTAQLSAEPNAAGWHREDVTVTLTAADEGAGVAGTKVRLNGGEWSAYTAPVAVTTEGVTTVEYFSTDAAGNAEQVKSLQVKLDKSSPVSAAAASPAPNASGWVNQDVTVTVASTDSGSGVAEVQAKVDDGGWTVYGAPLAVTAEGEHEVEYFAVDAAGNAEAVQLLRVRIDRTAPTAVLLQSGQAVHDVVYSDTLQFTLTAEDALSGVAVRKLTVDGAEVQSGQTLPASQLGMGAHTVAYVVEDAAGNKTEMSYSFVVSTSFAAVKAVIAGLDADGHFKNKGVRKSLEAKLEQVESKLQKNDRIQALKHLDKLVEDIAKDADKGDLTRDAEAVLLQHLAALRMDIGK